MPPMPDLGAHSNRSPAAEDGDDLADRDRMRRLVQGDDLALDELMNRHAGALTAYLERLTGDRSAAQDLAEETFVRLYRNRARFQPHRPFGTWIYTIATNLGRDHLRWRGRRPSVGLDDTDANAQPIRDTLADPLPDPAILAQREELAAAVRRGVLNLPEDLRTPLILAEYQGRRVQEIADILNCTAKAVEMRLYRARQRLRETLQGFMDPAA